MNIRIQSPDTMNMYMKNLAQRRGERRSWSSSHTHFTLPLFHPPWTQFQCLRFSIKPFLHFNNVNCIVEYCIPEFICLLWVCEVRSRVEVQVLFSVAIETWWWQLTTDYGQQHRNLLSLCSRCSWWDQKDGHRTTRSVESDTRKMPVGGRGWGVQGQH